MVWYVCTGDAWNEVVFPIYSLHTFYDREVHWGISDLVL